MKVSIEQVEKLKERTNVTYEEARDALQSADGDILEAVIALEKEGKTANSTAAFSTNNSLPAIDEHQNNDQSNNQNSGQSNSKDNSQNYNQNTGTNNGANYGSNNGQNFNQNGNQNYRAYNQNTSFGELMRKFFNFCGKIIHAGNINQFKVHRFGRETLSLPVTALVLLLIFFFPLTVTVLIVALFFEYRYSFRGPNLGKDNINRAMNNASDAAEDIKDSFKADNQYNQNSQNSTYNEYDANNNTDSAQDNENNSEDSTEASEATEDRKDEDNSTTEEE